MAQRRPSGPPRRTVSSKAVRRDILVFTEGLKTEVQYLTHLWRRHREHVLVRIDPFHGGPLQLVQHAVKRRKADLRAEQRGQGKAPAETWCMFDIDEHQNVPEAMQLAAAHDIGIAVSNPCLELWYLLHFKDQTAWIDHHAAQSDVGEFITKGKTLTSTDLELLVGRYSEAKERALRLARRHEGDGNPAGENPSSAVWALVDRIRTTG